MGFYTWSAILGGGIGFLSGRSKRVYWTLIVLWIGLLLLTGAIIWFIGELIVFSLAYFIVGSISRAVFVRIKGR